ncbi:transmembrane 4 L6 family member 1 isoform X2 [Stigmatopora argus]
MTSAMRWRQPASSSGPLHGGHPSVVTHALHPDRRMCVSRCLRCVGVALAALAMVCVVANFLLLMPELNIHFLLEGHVTREASWATGFWSSGLMIMLGARAFLQSSQTTGCCAFRTQMLRQALYSCACLLSSAFCCLVSMTGLVQGPLCLYNTTSGPAWGVPLKPTADRFKVDLAVRIHNLKQGYLKNRLSGAWRETNYTKDIQPGSSRCRYVS